MLYLIKGRAGSGKTSRMREIIKKVIDENNTEPLLIVPKQFSFESERAMLEFMGAKASKKLKIYSFSRLSDSILKETALINKSIPDSGVRLALMSEALKQLEGNLNIFNKSKYNTNTLESLVDFSAEMKLCKISGDELREKTEGLSDGFLKDKLNELSLINEAYDALINQSYFDDTTELDLLCDFARSDNIFSDKVIFIDGFRSFSKQEYEVFSVMLSQAKAVCMTLCVDEMPLKYSSMYFIKQFENRIRTIANEYGVPVEETVYKQDENSFSEDVFAVEKNLYSEKEQKIYNTDNTVTVAECVDIDDECRYVAATIKKLLRSGKYRCREIAVIERVGGTYKKILTDELKRLGVPVFEDSRRSLSYETLFIYLNAVLTCVTGNLSNENIFTYLKTGFSPLNINEVSRLEKYALIWGVKIKGWTEGFSAHPDGFGNGFDEKSEKKLKEINISREKAISPLLKLKGDCRDKNGTEITKCIYEFLVTQNVREKLYGLYENLINDGFPVEANRQSVSWDRLIYILDTMENLTRDKSMSLSEWYEKYKILVSSEEIGEIPQGLDEITIGSADRIRTEKKKVCFLVGVNKDEFPLVSVKGGILTDNDRVSLTNIGLNVKPPFKDTVDEERFISYCAVTAANERLYLSYKTVDSSGAELYPSEIVDCAKNSINGINTVKTTELNPVDLIEGEDSAFSVFCDNYKFDSTLRATLYEYFKDNGVYREKMKAIDTLLGEKPVEIENKEISTALFKENMQISASRVETFYKCPFAYFMRYGMNAEPLRTAELDSAQSGMVIHAVMENLLKKYPKCDFCDANNEELKTFVDETLSNYINEKLGGVDDKSSRFMFLYNRLLEICLVIIDRLKQEFSVGSFEPCGFEVKIGDENIPPYEVELDKGTAQIRGYIDRVDMMEKDGINYLRVIDYKTGTKEFKLSEVIDGLNIQMILYLMALEKNGQKQYGEFIPSAVLYLPSKIGFNNYLNKRNPEPEECTYAKKVSGKLSGMILDSPVVMNGMGVLENPDYFPVSFNTKKGSFTGNLYNQKQFRGISSYIDSKIKEMGDSLHNGKINPVPLGAGGQGKMCAYCSYKSVCGYESGNAVTEASVFNHKTALEILGGDENE